MSSDPKQYRANALRCARLAEEVTDNEVKTTLMETAQAWLNLAKQLERAQAGRDETYQGLDHLPPEVRAAVLRRNDSPD